MKLLVCIKQVPDMESRFKPDSKGVWYSETDLAWRMNEYDEYAVEEAVRLREQLGESCELTVLSIGPDRVGEVIKKALAMGADRAVHIQDQDAAGKDPWQIASIIAGYAQEQGYDIIFTGMQSQDRGSAQVGVLVAELLGYTCATTLVGFAYADGVITAKRELEGGLKGVSGSISPVIRPCRTS
jgi:electron transfer flavoprotein beta subunit